MRLLFIMWLFVLLPFGLYRTVWRYFLLKQLNEDYLNVFRPSEPFFYLFLKDKGTVCLAADACYATIFPLFIYLSADICMRYLCLKKSSKFVVVF